MIGKLDRRVIFIKAVIEQGDSNEDKITGWEEIEDNPEVFAGKRERGGNTFLSSEDRVVWNKQTVWTIRYRNDFESKNIANIQHLRLVWDTMVYQIINISELEDSRRRYMEVTTQLLDNIYFT